MNTAAHRVEGNANAPVLYMALELSNTTWKCDPRWELLRGRTRRVLAASAPEERRHREPGRGLIEYRGEPQASPCEDRPAGRGPVAGKAHALSRGGARGLERGAGAQRRG